MRLLPSDRVYYDDDVNVLLFGRLLQHDLSRKKCVLPVIQVIIVASAIYHIGAENFFTLSPAGS